jgi:UDP-N-acetylglucosamine diphosphorylase/glucosamine-1-phosphate N-acetyltransferase
MEASPVNIIFFEDDQFSKLLPLTYWRHVGALKCGTCSLAQRGINVIGPSSVGFYVRPEMVAICQQNSDYPVNGAVKEATLFINSRFLITEKIKIPTENSVMMCGDQVAAIWCDKELSSSLTAEYFLTKGRLPEMAEILPSSTIAGQMINYPWDLIKYNGEMITSDFQTMTPVTPDVYIEAGALVNRAQIAIQPTAIIKPSVVLDASSGPIIIGDHCEIKPNVTIEGPVYIGDYTVIQPNAQIRPDTYIGEHCRAGGEISATIMHGYSNKGHDGFLGDSYLAKWINLGAGTIVSNLKNTYGNVSVPINGKRIDSGETFVGLTMGDYCKSAINSSFSTGAVIGFGCNVLTNTVPQFLPSMSWLTKEGCTKTDIEKLIIVAERMMWRRNIVLTDIERAHFATAVQIAEQHEAIR